MRMDMNLPEYITDALKKNETSLGDNPAFPPGITGGRFLDTLLSKRFNELSKEFDGKSVKEIKDELYSDLNKCKEIEGSCKPALEKLCGDIVKDLFRFPEDTITIDMEISENPAPHKMRVEPDNGDGFEFDSVEDMGNLSSEIYKRRMVDALVEGASEYFAYNVQNYVQELFKIQPELPSIYTRIIKSSQFLTLTEDDTDIDASTNDGGYVIVKVGQIDEMPNVEARGAIFPILLQQSVKGVLEIAVLGGLPKDRKKARFVMSRADFGMAEKWDSRLGYPLWLKIAEAVEKSGNNLEEVGYNFVLMELANSNTSTFNKVLQEVFANTGKGTKVIGSMCDYITQQKEQDEFDDYIEQQNAMYPIEDGYFTAEELVRDLPELNEEKESDYDFFCNQFLRYANECIDKLKSKALSKLGISVIIDANYDFENKDWVASYVGESVDGGEIKIGLNLKTAYEKLKSSDDFNIKAQAYISVAHEIGHGLVSWIVNYYDGENQTVDEFIHDFYDGEINEEEIVEEFGEAAFPEATGVYSCRLEDVLFSAMEDNQINESVYINGVKGKKANLHYAKGQNYSKGNMRADDMLKTDKMDNAGADTYEVTLKGGLVSYNITSIKGTEVMHYFKRYFDHQKTNVELKSDDGTKQEYELQMQQNEFNDFMQQFNNKVSFVVRYAMQHMKSEDGKAPEFSKVSIYPVKSSSNFNEKMAQELSSMNINGLPVQIVDAEILSKDLKNLQKDEEFIAKNQKYYNGKLSPSDNFIGNDTVSNTLDKNIEKYKGIERAEQSIEQMNQYEDALVTQLNNYRNGLKNGRNMSRMQQSMAANYMKYIDLARQCVKDARYVDPSTNKEYSTNFANIAKAIKYTKGPSVDDRSNEIYELMKPYLRGKKSPVDGEPYLTANNIIPLCQWKREAFQIKNLTNGERMGLKNIYRFSDNTEKVQQELEKIKGTVLVVFDDNISGGATLSDVCYQFKQQGIQYIIPITFGKMSEKWTLGIVPLNKPTNDKGEEGQWNL